MIAKVVRPSSETNVRSRVDAIGRHARARERFRKARIERMEVAAYAGRVDRGVLGECDDGQEGRRITARSAVARLDLDVGLPALPAWHREFWIERIRRRSCGSHPSNRQGDPDDDNSFLVGENPASQRRHVSSCRLFESSGHTGTVGATLAGENALRGDLVGVYCYDPTRRRDVTDGRAPARTSWAWSARSWAAR